MRCPGPKGSNKYLAPDVKKVPITFLSDLMAQIELSCHISHLSLMHSDGVVDIFSYAVATVAPNHGGNRNTKFTSVPILLGFLWHGKKSVPLTLFMSAVYYIHFETLRPRGSKSL